MGSPSGMQIRYQQCAIRFFVDIVYIVNECCQYTPTIQIRIVAYLTRQFQLQSLNPTYQLWIVIGNSSLISIQQKLDRHIVSTFPLLYSTFLLHPRYQGYHLRLYFLKKIVRVRKSCKYHIYVRQNISDFIQYEIR